MTSTQPRPLVMLVLAVSCLTTRIPAQGPDDTVRVGDRIFLHVEPGLTDSARGQASDTFTVTPGPAVLLPGVGELSLAGVRRAELGRYLTRELERFVKHPVVNARLLVRLAVLGEVEHPGFYALPADAIVTDAIMAAGGPTRDAKFVALRIERDEAQIWAGGALQRAIARGRTIDALKLRAGDRIVVPRRRDATATVQIIGILLTVPAAIYGMIRLF